MSARTLSFTRYVLVLFAGPLTWAAHFLAIYGFAGVVCARPPQGRWFGVPVLPAGVLLAGAVALAVLLLAMRARPPASAGEEPRFLRRVATGLAWLAAFAIAWESATVLFFPQCPGAAA